MIVPKAIQILLILFLSLKLSTTDAQTVVIKPDTLTYPAFVWESTPPDDCPFEASRQLTGIRFTGLKGGFRYGDTWYPSWASNDTLYSPWTDGATRRVDGYLDRSNSGNGPRLNVTGAGVMIGDDPLSLQAYSIGLYNSPSDPYMGRYPCGSLVYNGVWYYGTYGLGPESSTQWGNIRVNWPWIGPFVGFRYSKDFGKTWTETPHNGHKPIFGENGINGYPVKIGSPHFVDFGKNMQHSPDGKAYLIAHGGDTADTKWRFWNNSWITGDQIYLLRVTPSIENMNDSSKYEFYAGKDKQGRPVWTHDFQKIKPLLEWNNNMGCVTITYNAPLKKYLMVVTDGGNTCSKMNTYILESDSLTGDWKLVTYMKDFGEQAYFVNIPSKFISRDGRTMWLLYSGNFADWNGEVMKSNPPGSHYGLVFQKIELLSAKN
ncbi:MAG: hypothetical protein H3C48_11105 [Chitinophagaceae bacterium]|nr:hypothetical protein [Chitinophagaceae bacterium]